MGALITALTFMAALQQEKPQFEHGFSSWEACYMDASKSPPELVEDPTAWDEADIARNVSRWFDQLTRLGATMIGVTVFDGDGTLYMSSRELENYRFRKSPAGDLLKLYCQEAKKRNVALDVGLESYMRAMGAAGSSYQQALDSLGPFVDDLGKIAAEHKITMWIDESGFPPDVVATLAEKAKAAGLKYYHFGTGGRGLPDLAVTQDYATYPRDLSPDRPEHEAWRAVADIGVTGLGLQTAVLGSQRAVGKGAGVAVSGGWGLSTGVQPNVALWRAVGFAPSLYTFVPAWMDGAREANAAEEKFVWTYNYKPLAELVAKYGRASGDAKRPVANLIVNTDALPGQAQQFWATSMIGTLDMVTNALTSAGYDVAVTETPMPDAALYYVIVAGAIDNGATMDLPQAFADLFEGAAKVVLHPVGAPIGGERWKKAAAACGLPDKISVQLGRGDAHPLPEKIGWDFPRGSVSLRYRGYNLRTAAAAPGDQIATIFTGAGPDAKVLASGRVTLESGDVTLPVLVQRKEKFFVNGNLVHFEFSSALANAISGQHIFGRPTYAYVTRSAERTALFAADATEIDVALSADMKTVVQFDEDAKPVSKRTVKIEEGRLTGPLKKWELVIVTK